MRKLQVKLTIGRGSFIPRVSRSGSRSCRPILPLLLILSPDGLSQEQKNVLPSGVGRNNEIRIPDQPDEQLVPKTLIAHDERLAFTFLPAIAVSGRRRPLQFAIVAFVANSGALGAATESSGQAASAALENVLIDVFGAGPGETAGVVAAKHVERRMIRVGAFGENHLLLFLRGSQLGDSLEEF